MSPSHRPSGWHELELIAGTYGVYTLTRNTLPAHVAQARANATDLYRAERRLHLDAELSANQFLAEHGRHWLAVIADYTYSMAHFGVTVAVLGWLYLARPHAYRSARTVLLLTTLLGLLGFWLYPIAPPRLFPNLGFIDTVVRDHTWGSWGAGAVTRISNQYAAMPSVHIAWSVWVAATIALFARRRWLRIAVGAYPMLVLLVIVATANHWTLDAVGGVAAVGVAASLFVTGKWTWSWLRATRHRNRGRQDLRPLSGTGADAQRRPYTWTGRRHAMSNVARVTEISADSETSFEDAIQVGLKRAGESLRGIKSAWVKEQSVQVIDGHVSSYRVDMLVTFLLDN